MKLGSMSSLMSMIPGMNMNMFSEIGLSQEE